MPKKIGLVVPRANDEVAPEGLKMYPHMNFVARGVGVKALTPEGYDGAWHAMLPAAEQLAREGVDAVMLMGTSLTFYRGFEEHERLVEKARSVTGLPVSTMSTAIVEGLRAMGAEQIGVCTAYADEVNRRLRDFLTAAGFDVMELQGFGLEAFGAPSKKRPEDIVELAASVAAKAPDAEALLISCGGLRTLEITKAIEDAHGVPVVSSTPASYWAAVRLAGENPAVEGYGKLLSRASL
jgi:arylmalonate decarboxylase